MFKYLLLFITSIASLIYAQSNLAAGINGNIDFATGKFSEYYNSSYGGDGHFLYLFGNTTIFSLTIGYNKFELDVDAFNKKAIEKRLDTHFNVESKFTIIPVLFGAKWYLLKQKKHSPYIMLEAGFYHYDFSFKGTANITNPGGNSIPIVLPQKTEEALQTTLKISAGYIYFFSRHWFIDGSVGYIVLTDAFVVNEPVSLETPTAIYGVVRTLNYISLLAGINYRF
jgi:hypothetical protein